MNERVKTACRLSIVACLMLGGYVSSRAEAAGDVQNQVSPAVTNLPPLLRPVALKDEDGNAEVGLVDPFRRPTDEDGVATVPVGDGLMRTTMGEISSEFRILAITIPADTNTPRTALIQFYTADEPILVHEGDLVRVDRLNARGRAGRTALRRGQMAGQTGMRKVQNGRAVAPRPPQRLANAARTANAPYQDADLEEQLSKFVFYVNVKHIEPTYIEVYHNKKRPDETIRLNW